MGSLEHGPVIPWYRSWHERWHVATSDAEDFKQQLVVIVTQFSSSGYIAAGEVVNRTLARYRREEPH